MEERRVRSVLLVCLLLGLLVGESTAAFKDCYQGCFLLCVLTPNNSLFQCSIKCLKDCIIPSSSVNSLKDTQYSCNLGCASSLCTNLSSIGNPGAEKVEKCVDSCSQACSVKN